MSLQNIKKKKKKKNGFQRKEKKLKLEMIGFSDPFVYYIYIYAGFEFPTGKCPKKQAFWGIAFPKKLMIKH